MNYNEKLKEIIRKIESDKQIKFEETYLPDDGMTLYSIDLEQITFYINLMVQIDGSFTGECGIHDDVSPSCGIYMLDELHDSFVSILKETNSKVYFKKYGLLKNY